MTFDVSMVLGWFGAITLGIATIASSKLAVAAIAEGWKWLKGAIFH